jgi:hypothetical protein
MPRLNIEIEHFERAEQDLAESSTERFDRIAFAERAVALVRPFNTRVVIREGTRRVHVEAGRQWGRAPSARWAVVSVPQDASRRAIATAVLALHEQASSPYRSSRAWRLDVLLGLLGSPNVPATAIEEAEEDARATP